MDTTRTPRPRSILAATDFSPAAQSALAFAAGLASEYGAELRLVHALVTAPPGPSDGELPAHRERLSAALGRLAEVAEPLRARGIQVHCEVEAGVPSEVILQHATAAAVDLLVVGTRG